MEMWGWVLVVLEGLVSSRSFDKAKVLDVWTIC